MLKIAREAASPELPGPGPLPVIGWRGRALRMLRDPAEYFMHQYRMYGELSSWNFRNRHIFAFGPAQIRAIFGQPEIFIADAFRAVRMPAESSFSLLSNGLLRLNGLPHRQHRRLMLPAFAAKRISVYRDMIVEVTEAQLTHWREGESVDAGYEMARVIMLIAMRSVFDIDAPDESARLQGLISRLLRVAASPLTLMLPYDLPGSTMRSALRACEDIETILRRLIRERRATVAGRTDMLSTMLSARDEQGHGLTEDELVSEAYTAFCHDSSTATLVWTLFLLDQHPAVLADLVDELRSILSDQPPTVEQLEQLSLLDAVLKESLRLFPPAPMLVRYVAEETELDTHVIPARATVFLSPYVTHRIPEIFERPLRFDPSRWANASKSAYEYLPFGAGAHTCIGRHFAMFEMKIILAILLQRYRLTHESGTPVNRSMRISLVPSHGMPMIVHKAGTEVPVPTVRGNVQQSVSLG